MLRLVAIVALVFNLVSVPVRAQVAYPLASVVVDIWPEFDRPAVLVITHIKLTEEQALPTIFHLRIPVGAEINAVAVVDENSGLLTTDYSRTVVGAWASLAITAGSAEIHVEYYLPLVRAGDARQIEYTWPGEYAVGSFQVSVQSPAGAGNMTIDPAPAMSQIDSYGLLTYLSEPMALEAGQTFVLRASYEKSDEELSIASMPVEPGLLLSETGGQMDWGSMLPWVLGGTGLVLLILGSLFLFGFIGSTSRKKPSGGKRVRRKKKSDGTQPGDEEAASEMVYCNECGRRAQAGDQFCRSCGTRLRFD